MTLVMHRFQKVRSCVLTYHYCLLKRTIAKMKNSTNTNLLILDEVFDSSLDANAQKSF